MAEADPRKHLNESERATVKKYSEGLLRDLEKAGFSEEEKKEIYDVMMTYEINYHAKENLARQYNALVDKLARIKARYEREPNATKAQEYLNQYNKNKAQLDLIDKKYNIFRDTCLKYEHRAVENDKKIDQAIALKEKQNKIKR